MADPVTVLVTAIGSGGIGEQILKALRLSKAGAYRIIGADLNPFCPQFEWVDAAVRLPAANDLEYVDALLAVCRHFRVRAAFPGSEPELTAMSGARERITGSGILLPISPESVIRTCMDKAAASLALAELGFEPPRFALISTREGLDAVDWYPVVVKPHIHSGGSKDCYIAQTPRELALLADYIGFEDGLFVQEYVGTPESEFTVGVLLDLDGNLLNSIAVRRELRGHLNIRVSAVNRTPRSDLGPHLVISSGISQGKIDRFPEVTEPCERLALALGARGAVNIQCRLVAGKVKVFEINPRFSGTTSIRAMMGYNEPDVLLRRHLIGEKIEPRFRYRSGTVVRSLTETILPTMPVPNWQELDG